MMQTLSVLPNNSKKNSLVDTSLSRALAVCLLLFVMALSAEALDTVPASQSANSVFKGTYYCPSFAFADVNSAAACEVAHAQHPSCGYHQVGTSTKADWHTAYDFRYDAAPTCGDGSWGAYWVEGNATQCSTNSTALNANTCQCNSGFVASGGRCLRVIDPLKNNGGCPANTCCTAGTNPINVGMANKFQIEKDSSDAANPTLSFIRYYNSSNNSSAASTGIFIGAGWRHFYDRYIAFNQLSTPMMATVYRPDGKVLYFTLNNGLWTSDADIKDRLTTLTDNTGTVIGWKYGTQNDELETYNTAGKLASISDRAGRTQTLSYSTPSTPSGTAGIPGLLIQVTDGLGRQLNFTYDTQFRIQTMIDATGSLYTYAYDLSNNLISVTYPDTKTRTYVYNELANTSNSNLPHALTGIIDENNLRFATYKYDASGRAISSEHAGGAEKNSIVYTTDANGTITSSAVTDALNATRTYAFAAVLGVAKNTGFSQPCSSSCGATSAQTYDANGNVSSKTDFNGNIINYVYDLTRNLETSRIEAYGTPQARTITTQWHATYRLPTLITEPGKTTALGYDTSGNLLTKTITDTALSKSRTWTWTYNSLGQVLTADGPRTDVLDKTTNTYYTSASSVAGNVHSIGDLATVTNALSQVTSITNYDLNGRPLTITDPNGVVTTLTYWPRGWLKSRTVNGSQITTYDYDGVGQLTKVTLPDASYLSYTYDTAHRLTDITDNAGNKTHYTLDAMGNRTQEDTKDPSGNILKTRSRIFDALNRLQKDIGGTSPSTQITQYGYDNNGNLKTITDPLNHITTNGYDALNRLITVTDPANGVATTTYNALDQVTQVKDPRLVTTDYTINALGDVTLTASPDSGSTNKVYDLAGNVTQKTDARGVVSNYTYDALNRVTSITYPANSAENVTFTYDSTANGSKGIGKLTFYGNDGGSTVLMYDSYGNVITQTEMIGSQFYVTAYQYDNANRLSQITSPSGRITTYTRNALGQITQIQTKENASASLVTIISNATYEPFGPIKTLTYGNGVVTTVLHDADYRTSRITASSTPVWDYQYSYDAAGNLIQQTDQVGTINKTFGYDALDRVTTDTNNTGNWTYQYDAAGNRTKRIWVNTSNATSTQTLTYATSSNRITKNGSATQTLDAAGNITGNGQTLAYNNANHLSLVSSGSTVKAGFRYNALNQRTSKLQITKPLDFHYGLGGQIIGLTGYNPAVLYQRNDYIWLDDIPVAQTRIIYSSSGSVSSRRTTYVHADHLNTPRAMTDSTGKLVWRWDGDAYASQKPNENPDGDGTTDALNLRFPGQFFDTETGLMYNWNRYYDPATGRYVQSDPIGLEGGLNTYGYVEGNPISDIDPNGLIGKNPKGNYRPVGCPRKELNECSAMCSARGGVSMCTVTRGSRSVIIGGNVTHEPYTVPTSMNCVCKEDDKPRCPPESEPRTDPIPEDPSVPFMPMDIPSVPRGPAVRPTIPIRVPIFVP